MQDVLIVIGVMLIAVVVSPTGRGLLFGLGLGLVILGCIHSLIRKIVTGSWW